ncbi:MAG: winged helix-turn-helix domain-containing protein, partial [Sedimenticola sp.]|nr:winged helix-turn-helix domain-containing protein [Sedimenticola sp.]
MALLLLLVEHAGETVSRDEIFRVLWPGVIVTDDTLTQAVIKLRKALGDSAKNPRFIKTVTKRGYRLCVPVTAPSDTISKSTPIRKRLLLISLLMMILAGGVISYWLTNSGVTEIPATITVDESSTDGLPTLTVEPFVLLGEDTSQLYLAQGLTQDLITDLSKLSALWVIGSRSIMGQKADKTKLTQVRYRVVGEVQRSGDQLRVYVDLIEVESGRQLWVERYQRPFNDLFKLQTEISQQIATTLSLKVSEAEQLRLAHRYTTNVQAYELFLKAQSLLLVREETANNQARQIYRQAITLDPSFARAYAGLALSAAADYRNQWAANGEIALQRAKTMARTALQINPDIPEVYWVLAYVNAQQRQHDKALRLLSKAISLDHSFADAYALMGGIYTYTGHPDETPKLLRTAIRLNPDAGYLYYLLLGRAYFYTGDWEQSLINLDEALERNPTNLEARIYLAAVMES